MERERDNTLVHWIGAVIVVAILTGGILFMWVRSAAYDNDQRLACMKAGGTSLAVQSGGLVCVGAHP